MSRNRSSILAVVLAAGLLAVLLLALRPPAAIGRELAVPESQLVEAELVGVGQLPGHSIAVALLRVDGEPDPVAIFIGLPEAEAIQRARGGVTPARPLTHELGVGLLDATGARVQRLVIDEMRDGAYFAALELKLRDRRGTVWVDSRPSDGLALAVRHEATILLSPQVVRAGTTLDPASPEADATFTQRL